MIAADSGLPFGAIGSAERGTMFVSLGRNSGRDMPTRFAFSSHAQLARLIASLSTAVSGAGTYSPFEQGPNLIGRPGSSAGRFDPGGVIPYSTSARPSPVPAPRRRR